MKLRIFIFFTLGTNGLTTYPARLNGDFGRNSAFFPPKLVPHPCYKLKHGVVFPPTCLQIPPFSAHVLLIFRHIFRQTFRSFCTGHSCRVATCNNNLCQLLATFLLRPPFDSFLFILSTAFFSSFQQLSFHVFNSFLFILSTAFSSSFQQLSFHPFTNFLFICFLFIFKG